MNIVQKRFKFGCDFTLSRLIVNEEWVEWCPYILEDAVRELKDIPVEKWKIPCETAIPVGRYRVIIDISNRFGKSMMRLMDVPGFVGIRIHAGNTSHDTEGCLITGKERDEKHGEVSGSRIAHAALFDRVERAISRGEEVWWTVEGLKEEA